MYQNKYDSQQASNKVFWVGNSRDDGSTGSAMETLLQNAGRVSNE